MKIICKCFGKYNTVNVRSSPFEKIDNIIDTLPSNSYIEIEHFIYNEKWFKIKDKEAYIISWLQTDEGLIDYVLDRGHLKTFVNKKVLDNIPKENIKENIKEIPKENLSEKMEKLKIRDEKPPPYKKSKKERIPATVRNIVWVTHFQTSKKGQCWLCKVEDISSANFECGHVVSEKNGGKPTIDNLRPICGFCNKSVGTMNMEDFKRKYNIN